MNRAMAKAERIIEMRRLYGLRAYSDREMAEHFGVDAATIYRTRIEIEAEYPLIREDDGRYRLDRSRNISGIRLNLTEALSLYVAGRRLAQQTRVGQRPVASALEKLAEVLRQPMTNRLVQAAERILQQQQDMARTEIFQTVAQGWSEQRKIRLGYRALRREQELEHIFAPYLLEPSPWNDGVYLIGHSSVVEKTITLRLDRITRATLLGTFALPDEFDEDELLRHAWGIWGSDGEPEVVRLRFAPGQAARRVQESIWHPLQQMRPEAEGSVVWEAPIADWREMLPWVRGWGADVVVLEPATLRDELIGEAQRLAAIYGTAATSNLSVVYYAHTKDGAPETEWQLLKDHLAATAELALTLGHGTPFGPLAQVAARLHDIGKYSQAFQNRLRGAKRPVDHATAGAREIMALFPDLPERQMAEILSYCIAGHHSGLPDYGSMGDMEGEGTLLARREKKQLEDYSAYQTELDPATLQLQPPRLNPARFRFDAREKPYPGFCISFFTRMIFSTLVDADWLETERFMSAAEKPRGQYASLAALAHEFETYMQRFSQPQSDIHRKRNATLHACIAQATRSPGFFNLTVPTGGGKTLASMAFALKHATHHQLRRIIYVIPFTSIIEQNAAVFRTAFGPLGVDNVLEHHANLDWEQLRHTFDGEGHSAREKLKLAAENWDIPVVVTTNVQFFESLFANKKSRARKLHNIANSVIIFDEVQMLPGEFLKPCLLAISELVQNYGVSIVFSTATQPALQDFFPTKTTFTELAPDPHALYDFYRRVQVQDLGDVTDEELLTRLNAHEQALCIVNTRRHAKGLFDGLTGEGAFHLSTLMCPAHRQARLAEIRARLQQGQACRVVSTQVMEAGIDIDFPVGYRALAGLDSIIQAAGRVNREGKQPSGTMYVFRPQTPLIRKTPTYIAQMASVAQSTMRDHATDPTTIEAISAYYRMLYAQHDEKDFDAKGILNFFEKNNGLPDFDFKTAAENFKLIDDNMIAVMIPYNDQARQLLQRLQTATFPASILRTLQSYTINIYEREFLALQSLGAIQTIHEHYHALDERWMATGYHPQTGLVLPESSGGAALFFD